MDIKIFYKSLDIREKKELLKLIIPEFVPNVEKENFTTMEEFVAKHHDKMTTRTRNILKANKDYFSFIEVIDPNDLERFRNASKTVVNEFIKLRGF